VNRALCFIGMKDGENSRIGYVGCVFPRTDLRPFTSSRPNMEPLSLFASEMEAIWQVMVRLKQGQVLDYFLPHPLWSWMLPPRGSKAIGVVPVLTGPEVRLKVSARPGWLSTTTSA
jgi:hypothetical protein